MTANSLCPCGSGQTYEQCCGLFISGAQFPETAEQLMRSRYTAFHNGNLPYLLETLHPSKHSEETRIQYQDSIENTQWQKLLILKTERGTPADQDGYVEFAAFYEDEIPGEIHEKSKFIRENGRWYYLLGRFLPLLKQGRNDPCLCGSGKKFKKCHGR